MVEVSVVIITKNMAGLQPGCLEMASKITDDVVIVCNEKSEHIAAQYHKYNIYYQAWMGYSANKNKGIEAARYDRILSIDSDEVPDEKLVQALHNINFENTATVYDIKFRSYFGERLIRYGSWGRDHHIRLFDRTAVKWKDTLVHETLALPPNAIVKKIDGAICHYSVKDAGEFDAKGIYYSKLSAKKYLRTGKKVTFSKMYLSPVFGFVKNYIFLLGFLDGEAGWQIAKTTFKHTRRKYQYLAQLENAGYDHRVKNSLVLNVDQRS